ncbi:MAG: hypothetical protein JTT12_05480 [Candidatus Brockarchaeota archaeon]|nr:hypothetical protein [Candidatus Brockarchaeota archaeon]
MNNRPMWELKAIADLLLAVSLLAYIFGVIQKDVFLVVFMAIFNYIALNASQSKIYELSKIQKLEGILAVDYPLKLAVFGFGLLCGLAYLVHAIDYDTATKVLTLVATILAANLGYLEYKLR